ncbi:11105_t:CDS:2 [Ambispora leptoticha]|uniref:11105_t:CDS:1 n=1 Tax=Ambispora leptoticha TaxID=144679 RepID=A0A9N9A2H7_9GLOM|nr:11105_t:CDS:2 [Ambispora leptoticha]
MGNLSSKIKRNSKEDPFFEQGDSYVDRSQAQHHLIRALFNSNFSAPVLEILHSGDGKVLDVCCGPGTWVCDNSSDFPQAKFSGVDINPYFPTQKPYNVQFVTSDILKGLPYDETFDFVHLRFFGMWFTEKQFKDIILPEMIRVLRPGGWIELCETDYDLYNTGPLGEKLAENFQRAMASRQLNPIMNMGLACMLQDTCKLKNIEQVDRVMPMYTRDAKLGKFSSEVLFRMVLKVSVDAHCIKVKDAEKTLRDVMAEANRYATYGR